MAAFKSFILNAFSTAVLFGLLGCASLSSRPELLSAGPTPVPTPNATPSPTPNGCGESCTSSAPPTFAFWYRPWSATTTPPEVKPIDVVIGVAPAQVADVHKLGKRALQYQTYYQAAPGTPLLTTMSDLPKVGFEIGGKFVLNPFGHPNSYIMCPNSTTVHKRVQLYVQSALNAGYDGLMVDNTFFDPPAHKVCDAAHPHLEAGVQGGRAFLTLLEEVRQQLNAHKPNMLLVTNPGSPTWADGMATGSPTLWDLSDFVVWESYGYAPFTDSRHDVWDSAITRSFQLVEDSPVKAAKTLALSYVFNVSEARYAFAVARLFGMNWTANLGATPWGSYFNQIPYNLGNPVGPLPSPGPLLQRTFEHGQVFINAGTVAQTIDVPPGTLYLGANTSEITASTQMVLQPRSAAILISQ